MPSCAFVFAPDALLGLALCILPPACPCSLKEDFQAKQAAHKQTVTEANAAVQQVNDAKSRRGNAPPGDQQAAANLRCGLLPSCVKLGRLH